MLLRESCAKLFLTCASLIFFCANLLRYTQPLFLQSTNLVFLVEKEKESRLHLATSRVENGERMESTCHEVLKTDITYCWHTETWGWQLHD